jgi:uncharacterized protein (TIGR03067 family)
MIWRALFATGVVLMAASYSWSDEKEEAKVLEGTWIPTTAELGGQKFPDEITKTIKLVLKGNEYTVNVGERVDKGTCKLDVSAKPKTIDITGTEGPNKGKTFPAIYEHKGDTLKVCYNLGGPERPTEFKSKEGTQLFLVTYERKK